jgi:predicted small lipoprotein YifL
MIKKITLISLILCALVSCGKKGSPKYIDPSDCLKYQNPEIKNICIKYKDPMSGKIYSNE